MPPVVIPNPILNAPYDEPTRHFRFGDEGITDELVEERRRSAYFIPIARPRGKSGQLTFETEWTGEPGRGEQARQRNPGADRRNLWVPGVNAHGGLGRWAFLEVADPWSTQQSVRAAVRGGLETPEPAKA